jgi:hypothetical protein
LIFYLSYSKGEHKIMDSDNHINNNNNNSPGKIRLEYVIYF